MFSVMGGRRGAWGKFFEKMFTSLDREGGMSFQITGTSVVVSTETCDVTGCVVAGARIWDVTWCESPSSSPQLTRSSEANQTCRAYRHQVKPRLSAVQEPPEIPWWVGYHVVANCDNGQSTRDFMWIQSQIMCWKNDSMEFLFGPIHRPDTCKDTIDIMTTL